MISPSETLARVAARWLPAPLARRLGGDGARRFLRFVSAALVAVITSQVALGVLSGPVRLSAGTAGVIAAVLAALVSYLMSRWAWERKGKPDLLRETLPFWAVSLTVWIILGLTSHYSSVWAHSMGYTHVKKHLVIQGAYLVMNCLTFLGRFLIFHFFLFGSRRRSPDGVPATPHHEDIATADAVPVRGRHRAG